MASPRWILHADMDAFYASIEQRDRPELRGKPVIIGESDPDGCAACTGNELDYRNGPLYASYTAASFPRKLELAARHGIELEGAVTWAFTFANQPYFAGFRQLTSNGIPLAVFNAFRMLARLGPERVAAESSGQVPLSTVLERGVRERADVGALASRETSSVSVLVWHYHDDDVPGPAARVRLRVSGLPGPARSAKLAHLRVDETHGNAYATWRQLGSPALPTEHQYAQLRRASDLPTLTGAPTAVPVLDGTATIEFSLGRQAVSLLLLSDFG
jgi:xylan 1,4-beta-xylosidase